MENVSEAWRVFPTPAQIEIDAIWDDEEVWPYMPLVGDILTHDLDPHRWLTIVSVDHDAGTCEVVFGGRDRSERRRAIQIELLGSPNCPYRQGANSINL